MIEINLLPGSQKKRAKAGSGFSLRLPETMPAMDRMMVFIVAAWIIGPLLFLWLFLGVRGSMSDVRADLETAVADSARFAAVIETQTRIRARQDTIAEKLEMIQQIDAGRYVWPHIMDEVSRALPPFTWLTAMYHMPGGGATPRFQIEGRTGSLPALTRFMDALEASPFLRSIELISSEQATDGEANNVVNTFVLGGVYETPPMDVLETTPLFEAEEADTVTTEEATNGTGTP
jgi:Tfp pilus assembly protein PilN